MLGTLTDKMQALFSKLSGKSRLTEENISEAVSEVRLALLEADVNFAVVKHFIKKVKEKALGNEQMHAVLPGDQFIKIVHDELVALMGEKEASLNLDLRPSVIMLVGLQGSGKTTQAAKLARFLKKKYQHKKILLAACDLQRPAAVLQLVTLGKQIQLPVFSIDGEKNPLNVARKALEQANKEQIDILIVDTAGRLHIDDALMHELEEMKSLLKPTEVLFVASATTGQDAAKIAKTFHERIGITGSILTMLDGNTRGGAAISIREMTGAPLKFEGVGEKIEDIQPFHPVSMADRILGMGDTINLVRKAEEHISKDQAKDLEKKIKTATFTYSDYLSQMQAVKKMGPLKSLLNMLPGASRLQSAGFNLDEKELSKVEAIILSMNAMERDEFSELSVSRRKRIAKGSGTSLDDVNKLIKSFKQAKLFFKNMSNVKLDKMMGGALWR